METLSETLWRAIVDRVDCGESQHALARRSGVDVAAINRFIHRKQGLSLVVIDRLALALGLELRPRRKARRGGGTS
jgi:hypothetical protein